MKGNFHVRFLGEEAAVMLASLPDRRKIRRSRQWRDGSCIQNQSNVI